MPDQTYSLKFKLSVQGNIVKVYKQQVALQEKLLQSFNKMETSLKFATVAQAALGAGMVKSIKPLVTTNKELEVLRGRLAAIAQQASYKPTKGLVTFIRNIAEGTRDSAKKVQPFMPGENLQKSLTGSQSALQKFKEIYQQKLYGGSSEDIHNAMGFGLLPKPSLMGKFKAGLKGFASLLTGGKGLAGGVKNLKGMAGPIGAIVAGLQKAKAALAGFVAGMFALGMASPYLQAQMAFMAVNMQQIGMIIGDSLVPILQALNNGLEALMNWWNSLDPTMQQAIKDTIMITTALAAIIVIVTTLGPLISSFGVMIGLVVGAIFALSYAWESNFLGIQDITKTVVDFIMGLFDGIVNFFTKDLPDGLNSVGSLISDTLNSLGDLFSNIWNGLTGNATDFVTSIVDTIKPFMNFLIDGVNSFVDVILAGFKLIKDQTILGVKPFAGALAGTVTAIADAKIPRFAQGGVMPYTGLAILEKGEPVFNASQQKRLFDIANGRVTNNNNNQNQSINVTVNYAGSGSDLANSYGFATNLADELKMDLRRRGVL